jgi:hypothetical protein
MILLHLQENNTPIKRLMTEKEGYMYSHIADNKQFISFKRESCASKYTFIKNGDSSLTVNTVITTI